MGSATLVPQTRTMELSADDAWTTLKQYGMRRLAHDSFVRFRYGDGMSHSRALAFQLCLSIIPGTIALVGLASLAHQEHLGQVLQQALSNLAPGEGGAAVLEILNQGARTRDAVALWLGLGTALASLTSTMAQVERGANRIYGMERDRPFHRKYGRAIILALTAGALMVAGFVAMVGGAAIGDALASVYQWGPGLRGAFDLTRWPVGFLLALASTSVLFRAAPRRRQPGHTWLAFGALVTLALWMTFTMGLALYTGTSGTFGSTYGPLTAVMALLLWAFLSSIALFLGLAFAAQLESCRAGCVEPALPDKGPTAQEEREPLVGAVGSAAIAAGRRLIRLTQRGGPPLPRDGEPSRPEA
ncbi:YihY/virulence factor BrkB family protein [Nonomuraea dietziae]|uniref:YihY/virulence factor BrkB family protein n=1 Tax=Nonomuraea dietziae TaxID=65515 RepID=UPI0033E2A015